MFYQPKENEMTYSIPLHLMRWCIHNRGTQILIEDRDADTCQLWLIPA